MLRVFLTAILFFLNSYTFGQVNMSKLIQGVKIATLPYSTEQFKNKSFYDDRKSLHSLDSVFIMQSLKNISPIVLNPYGGSSFGEIDCPDTSQCFYLLEMKGISLLSVLKTNGIYLLHAQLEMEDSPSVGLIISINNKGNIINWLFSDGSLNDGNPHGNISRNMTILSNKLIKINEVSWGDNTMAYSLKATFQIGQGTKANDDIENGSILLKSFSINY
ncbi:MAG: hypothetical protein INR69_13300 [Mucilaginibacter polytrichastri]|nr:hypothetical protein [Mucilaginibacter polytrichastri]